MKLVFPSMRYHKDFGAKVIQSMDEHDLFEKHGWAMDPAEFGPKYDSHKMAGPFDVPKSDGVLIDEMLDDVKSKKKQIKKKVEGE